MRPGRPQLELFHTRYTARMAPWSIPALKAVLPHVKTLYDTAAPVFTKKQADAVPDPTPRLQQQIAELQAAAAQNTAHVKELAGQLQSTVTALPFGVSPPTEQPHKNIL